MSSLPLSPGTLVRDARPAGWRARQHQQGNPQGAQRVPGPPEQGTAHFCERTTTTTTGKQPDKHHRPVVA